MYQLYVEDLNGIWKIADMGDDKPAMNYQANNIAELKDRQANYSQALKLPPTKKNCLIFGMSEQFDVVTVFPYQKHNCRLFSNDTVLAGEGSFLVLDKVTDFFETQILSGTADFFELMANQKISEINLGYFQRAAHTNGSGYSDTKYVYANATFITGGSSVVDNSLLHAYPFIWFRRVIENLMPTGFTLNTNLTNSDWNTKAISICSLDTDMSSFTPYSGQASQNGSTSTGYVKYNVTSAGSQNNLSSYLNGTTSILKYKASFGCTFRLDVDNEPNPYTLTIRASKFPAGGGAEIILVNNYVLSPGDQFAQILALNYGDELQLTIKTNNSVSITGNVGIVIWSGTDGYGDIDIARNIGFDTKLDLFKSFVQLYGLTVLVDNKSKQVYALSMKNLYANKVNAIDWSDKIQAGDPETSFILSGYAQNNYISFEADANGYIDKGNFTIQNDILDKWKDLFSIKFESGIDYLQIANIPLEEKDSEGVVSFKGGKPHIVDIMTASGQKYARHSTVQSFVDSFYPELAAMLDNFKINEEFLSLKDEDVKRYNSIINGVPQMFIPVYVQKYGAYFYVNKIVNYISGELTKCQLIKL